MKKIRVFLKLFIILIGMLPLVLYSCANDSGSKNARSLHVKKTTGKSGVSLKKSALLKSSKNTQQVTREFLAEQRKKYPSNKKKIMLVGLDGATLDVIKPLVEQGRLPFIGSLMKRGVHGPLQSTRPIRSPAIWTSIATGKPRNEHGITDFVTMDAHGSFTMPVTRHQRKTKAVWNMLNDFDRRSLVINWWATYPPEHIKGCIVSDLFEYAFDKDSPNHPLQRLCYPAMMAELLQGIDERIDREIQLQYQFILHDILMSNMNDEEARKAFKQLKEFIRSDLLVSRTSEQLINMHKYDLNCIYFQGIDIASHHFWNQGKYTGNEFTPVTGGPVVAAYYAFTDKLLASLNNVVDSSTNWIIVSDHGFRSNDADKTRKYRINHLFERLGYLAFLENSDEVDLARTCLYDPQHHNPFDSERRCFLNVPGDNSDVTTGGNIHGKCVLHDLQSIFSNLKTGSRKKVFNSVQIINYPDGKRSLDNPDMVFRFNPGLSPDDSIHVNDSVIPLESFVYDDYTLPGTHEIRGIFIAAGPDFISRANVTDATVFDIVPTLLSILDMPQAEDFKGKVLSNVLRDRKNALTTHTIPTYETPADYMSKKPGPENINKKALQQLKDLGYIE